MARDTVVDVNCDDREPARQAPSYGRGGFEHADDGARCVQGDDAFSFCDVPQAFFRFLGQFFVKHPVAASGFVAFSLVGAYGACTSPPRRRGVRVGKRRARSLEQTLAMRIIAADVTSN